MDSTLDIDQNQPNADTNSSVRQPEEKQLPDNTLNKDLDQLYSDTSSNQQCWPCPTTIPAKPISLTVTEKARLRSKKDLQYLKQENRGNRQRHRKLRTQWQQKS